MEDTATYCQYNLKKIITNIWNCNFASLDIYGKNSFAERSKILGGYQRNNFVEHQNNYIERSNCC